MNQEKKNKEELIIEKIDRAINELVYEKTSIIKAYNYYHGRRDPEQFRHLEENYGIGTSTSVEFVPLVKKHIDVLIGEYLSLPLLPKVSCKDKGTIEKISGEKNSKINSSIAEILKNYLRKTVESSNYINSTDDIDREIKRTIENIDKNFISSFEIAGQNITQNFIQSRTTDFVNKRKTLLTDLLVSGTMYYQARPNCDNTAVELRELNPVHTFIDRNPNSPYLNKSLRAVIRTYMSKQDILVKYAKLLKEEDLEALEDLETYTDDGSSTTYLRSYDSVVGNVVSDGVLGGFEVTPLLPFERNVSKYYRMYPVYEVEWLQADKDDKGEYIMNRYEGVRISNKIYIPIGKSENVVRSITHPKECSLSINGLFYLDRNGDPFSLILSTANLQDRFDCLNFYRDNIIAESGSIGDWVDVAHLPKFLGADVTERLLKFKAYKKQGLALYDSSQEGDIINTAFNGYDDTIKIQTIQAIDLAIQRVEETCSTITGVFKEKLGGIEQKDAVTNVQVGVTQSTYVTKQYYQLMDLVTREMLSDLLDIAKKVYKNGVYGVLVLGEKLNSVFTALPEHFTFTDFDIHIVDNSELRREQETIKGILNEFAKAGVVDPEIIIEAVTAKGLTELKADVIGALNKKKEENNVTAQLDQQVKQLDQQLKQATQQTENLQKEVARLNEEKIKLERDRLAFEQEVGWYKVRSERDFNDDKIELDTQRVKLEALQLVDNNNKNDEVKNS